MIDATLKDDERNALRNAVEGPGRQDVIGNQLRYRGRDNIPAHKLDEVLRGLVAKAYLENLGTLKLWSEDTVVNEYRITAKGREAIGYG